MTSLPRKNAIASGRRRPWVSEMRPIRGTRGELSRPWRAGLPTVALRPAAKRQILEANTATAPESVSRLGHSLQELGMVLQPIIEPIVFALEADQHTSRLPVPGDDDLLGLSQAQES